MLPMSAFLDRLSLNSRDIANWMNRLELNTHYEQTVAGRSRQFHHENVLELALVSAFVKIGMPPLVAVRAVRKPIADWANSRPIKEWAVFGMGKFDEAQMVDSLDAVKFDQLTAEFNKGAPIFSLVQIGEIVRRVDALFARELEEA